MNEFYTKQAAELVIMDALAQGHTNKNELIDYMKSEVFASQVKVYVELFSKQFGA